MLEMLMRFVFNIVSSLMQTMITPFITIVINLFPSAQVYFTYIATFFANAFTYLTTIYRWFLFTPAMFLLLFDYYAVKFSIWVVASGIRLGLKVYNYLKP